MEHKTLLLIDGNAIVYRSFHGIPALKTKEGVQVNAVYGFVSSILAAIKLFHPEYLAVAFDVGKKTFRNDQYKEYKANRVKMPDELAAQLPLVKEVCKVMNIPQFGVKNFEADDVIGTITEKISAYAKALADKQYLNDKKNSRHSELVSESRDSVSDCFTSVRNDIEVIIVTGDMDTLQLVNDNVSVYSVSRGIKRAEIFNEQKVQQKYGFASQYLIDYKGLRGDPSDNIPGVPGIGEVTAKKLIKEFGNIENLYSKILNFKTQILNKIPNSNNKKNNCHSELVSESQRSRNKFGMTSCIKPKTIDLLLKHKEQAFLSKSLATIKKDVPLDFRLADTRLSDYNQEKVIKLFQQLEFKSLIAKLPDAKATTVQKSLF